MNQTGSGLGAGFFMSEWKKRTGHKSKYEKSPDSVGKSGRKYRSDGEKQKENQQFLFIFGFEKNIFSKIGKGL